VPSALQLRKITSKKLGIRNNIKQDGESGAGYALSDLGDRVNGLLSSNPMAYLAFLGDPERGGEWEREWAQRYYNSVGNIKRLAADGKGTLVLYEGVGFAAGAERYRFPGGLGEPPLTFRKAQVPLDAVPLAQFYFTEETSIQQLLGWVTAHIDGMPA